MNKSVHLIETRGRIFRLDGLVEIQKPNQYFSGRLVYSSGFERSLSTDEYGQIMAALSTHPDVSIHRVPVAAKPDDDES